MIRKYLAILFIFCTISLGAEEVSSILIHGDIKKTRENTIYNIIGYHEGDSIDIGSEEMIRQDLIESGLFIEDSIDVEIIKIDDQTVIKLTLNEKFSLIPIPIVQAKDGELSAGLFLLNSNFLGLGDQFFVGGIFSKDNQMAMSRYYHKYFLGSAFGVGGNLFLSNGETEITDTKGAILKKYDAFNTSAGVTIGWDSDPWEIHFSSSFGITDFKEDGELSGNPIYNYSPELGLVYDNRYYGSYFTEGILFDFALKSTQYSESMKASYTANSSFSWAYEIIPRLQLLLAADGYIYEGESLYSPSVRSLILPGTVHADSLMKSQVTITPVLFDFNWAYLALPLTFTAGYLDGISGDSELFYGPAASLTFNFKKVAIPAVSFTYGINMETMDYQIQANLGFQF